jgi:hypothetical protein
VNNDHTANVLAEIVANTGKIDNPGHPTKGASIVGAVPARRAVGSLWAGVAGGDQNLFEASSRHHPRRSATLVLIMTQRRWQALNRRFILSTMCATTVAQ